VISVILPAFNEESALPGVISGLKKELPRAEIIVVDDGSTDGTERICGELKGEYGIKCVRLKRNRGKTVAFAEGLRKSHGDKVILFESDGQYDAADAARVAKKLDEFDVVNGVRTKREDAFYRKVLSKVHNIIQRRAFGLSIRDANSGLKGFKRPVAMRLFSDGMLEKFNRNRSYHRIALSVAAKLGYSVGWVDVSHFPRKGGKSYISPIRTPVDTALTFARLAAWNGK